MSLRTIREEEVRKLFTEAYDEAVNKLRGLAGRLAASYRAIAPQSWLGQPVQ